MISLEKLQKEIRSKKDPKRAKILSGFFKTGKGQYGEGDKFLGMVVPETRKIAKKYKGLSFVETKKLLHSEFHEERLCAVLMLVHNFQEGDEKEKEKIYNFYLKNSKYINNWDLVDLSAHYIVGQYLLERPRDVLYELAGSENLWQKRVSILATFWFIKNGDFKDSFKLFEALLNDEHDLIHKAIGWMLREIGKRDLGAEEKFLKDYYKSMSRTTLRYAIERFPEEKRQKYLKGLI